MKKIFKYSLIVSLCATLAALTGCMEKELDVNPLGDAFTLSGMAPNPVMRGGELRIFGRKLDQVSEVRFAGEDITVTEFIRVGKGAKLDTLFLLVPIEGPEVGKVSIVAKDGTVKTSQSDLTFSEPIEIESFSPASVLSRDVLTIKGEYLNDVKEVIFAGENSYATVFESQDRHELKVVVPSNAISGPVILSDVNEIEDENTIPNHIYTATDLVVGNPTVTKAAKATYKSGDVITVTGEHLDMIKNVALPQVSEVEFKLDSADFKKLTFNLPPKAADGHITLTSFAGVEFDAGEIETVTVSELAVASLAQDGRYKAGCQVEITGGDLDLVTKVEFEGAEADWYLDKTKIVATQPDAAKDGAVVVTLESGKKAYSDAIEVVKPVVTAVDTTAATAGKDVIVVSGHDLDLVTKATIGNKAQSFIDCEIEFVAADSTLKVAIPEQAYSGVITLTPASGYEAVTESISIVYDMAVSIKFDAPSFGLGQNISLTGKNLLQIDRIYIKGKRVTSFAVRSDDAMSFAIPEGLGPGVYRLALTLMDESEMTWPIPFEITAPFTETFYWEGDEDLGNWSSQPYLGADGALAGNVVVGDVIRIYYTPYADWWQFEIFDGHWGGMSFPELGGGKAVTASNTDPDATYFAFEVTDDNIGALTDSQGWGGIFVVQGESVKITGVSVIHFGAAEKRTTIWEGETVVGNWDNSNGALSWGGYDWSTVEAGTKLAVSFTTSDENAVMRFGNGSWASLPSLAGLAEDGNIPVAGLTSYEFELTAADLDQLVNAGGLVICGAYWTLTEVALVTVEAAGPQEKTIWEGETVVGNWDNSNGELSWGGYDWSTVEAGTTLVAHFTTSDENAVMRFGNGSWASLPSLAGLAEDGNIPVAGLTSYEFELTADDLDQLVNAGGLVVCGAYWTLTAIGLK
ncbi:MAG: hypothetical protein J5740_03085 [Bacteroidales bacterium]|nr:hypothetical protein [Bacteroidales bacterium]